MKPVECPMPQDAGLENRAARKPLARRVHAPSCPDPDEHLGLHEGECPCAICYDTGWRGADVEEGDCPCPASERPFNERHAQLDRVRRTR